MPFRLSQLVSCIEVGNGFVEAGHITGRAIVSLPERLYRTLWEQRGTVGERRHWFDLIVGCSDVEPSVCLEHLIRSHLLIHQTVDELSEMRQKARLSRMLRMPAADPLVAFVDDAGRGSRSSRSAVREAMGLVQAPGLITADLGAGHHLAYAVGGVPTEIDPDILELLTSWGDGIGHIAVDHDVHDLPVVRFLQDRGLLVSSQAIDRAPAAEPVVRVRTPTRSRWQQLSRPFRRRDFAHVHGRTRLLLVGPCQIQSVSEILCHVGLQAGILVDIISALDAEIDTIADDIDAVWLTSATYADSLFAAVGRHQWAAADAAIGAWVRRVMAVLTDLRQRTQIPVFVFALSRPGWCRVIDDGHIIHAVDQVLDAAHGQLAQALRSIDDASLLALDETRGAFNGLLWDDLVHGTVHHAALANWQWPVFKPRRSQAVTSQFVPQGTTQADPSLPMARAIMRSWSAQMGPRITALILHETCVIPQPVAGTQDWAFALLTDYADVEDYAPVGIHETLCLVRSLGVSLILLSSRTHDELASCWPKTDLLSAAVVPADVDAVLDLDAWRADPDATMQAAGLNRETTLYCADLSSPAVGTASCRRWRGSYRDIRAFLLTILPLYGPQSGVGGNQPAVNHARGPLVTDTAVDDVLLELIERYTGVQAVSLEDIPDLRDLGIDSIKIAELITAVERRLGRSLPSSVAAETVAFHPLRLRDAIAGTMHDPMGSRSGATRAAREVLVKRLRDRLLEADAGCSLDCYHGPGYADREVVGPYHLRPRCCSWQAVWAAASLPAGSVVLIALPVGADLYSCFLATIFCGAIPILIPAPIWAVDDPEQAKQWLAGLPNVAPHDLACVVVADAVRDRVEHAGYCVRSPRDAAQANPAPELRISSAPSDQPVLGLLSSGSTGRPKTIYHPAGRILSRIDELAAMMDLHADDVLCSWIAPHHTIGAINMTLLPILMDVRSVFIASQTFLTRPGLAARIIERSGASIAFWPNFAFAVLANALEEDTTYALRRMRMWVNAGEVLTSPVIERFERSGARHGLARGSVSSGYGMAEAAGAVTQSLPAQGVRSVTVASASLQIGQQVMMVVENAGDQVEHTTLLSSGVPLPSMQVHIHDAAGARLPEGSFGLIHLMDATDESTIVTRDLGFVAEGELYVVGRYDNALLIGGRIVHPEVVETAVVAVAGVRTAMAFAGPDHERGTDALGLGVVLDPGVCVADLAPIIRRRIRERCGEQVGLLVEMSAHLCTTPSGKLMRAETTQSLIVALAANDPGGEDG